MSGLIAYLLIALAAILFGSMKEARDYEHEKDER